MKYETLIKRAMTKEIKKQLKKERNLDIVMLALNIQFPSFPEELKWEMIYKALPVH